MPSKEIPDNKNSNRKRTLILVVSIHIIISCVKENSGCGQVRVSLQVMKSSSTTHGTAASTREFMKHASNLE